MKMHASNAVDVASAGRGSLVGWRLGTRALVTAGIALALWSLLGASQTCRGAGLLIADGGLGISQPPKQPTLHPDSCGSCCTRSAHC
jgi:hypothetical protein